MNNWIVSTAVFLLLLLVGRGVAGCAVNATTLSRKIIFGYQGWFSTDKADGLGWIHWSRGVPSASTATFDLFPDVSNYPQAALSDDTYLTSRITGRSMELYDSLGVVDVHFSWMQQYGIHGVAVQRFVVNLAYPNLRERMDQILLACRKGAEKYARVFFVEYDTSGADTDNWADLIRADWKRLTTQLNVTSSSAYQKEGNKPVLKIFGIGFHNRPGDSSDSLELVKGLKSQGVLFIGSVPTFWRDGAGDSKSGYSKVYQAMDVISPWLVGRYATSSNFDDLFYGVFLQDLSLTSSRQQGYAPTVFPGFSWTNLQRRKGRSFPLNQIPRRGGRFWEYQVNAFMNKLFDKNTNTGAYYIFGAMFDEFDESTAMIKAAPTADFLPLQGTFLHLSIDGEDIPSDHYLILAGKYSQAYSQVNLTTLIQNAPDYVATLSTEKMYHYRKRANNIELARLDLLNG